MQSPASLQLAAPRAPAMRLSLLVPLAAFLTFGLAGCGGDDATPDSTSETATAQTSETTAQTTTGAPAPSAPAGPAEQTHTGELAAGDETLQTGEYADIYNLTVREGQTVIVDATTDGELDPYVILRAPSGSQEENDDHEGSTQHARLEHVATEAGSYSAIVTSYEPGEAGSYTARLTVRD